MAWNEPGGNGSGNGSGNDKDNDPWGNRKNPDGPPDLDEVFKNLKDKLDGMMGRRGGGRSGGGNNSGPSGGGFTLPGNFGARGIGILGALALVLWMATGFYVLQPAEKGVITQFGAYKHTTDSGLHWRLPWPFQAMDRVNVGQNRTLKLLDQPILTQDENIVVLELAVQYRIKSASDYLFRVRDPDSTLQEVLESALREVVGQTDMEPVITDGRTLVDSSTRDRLQEVLDNYESGIEVIAVALDGAQPPEQVQAAFSDVIKAREDKERFINEAEAYRNEILPQARGEAQQYLEEALAYKSQLVNAAEGESKRFTSLLVEYDKAPEITRDRLYIEAMESVLGNTNKVMMGGENGNSLMYLPIDKLMESTNTERRTNNTSMDLPAGTNTQLDITPQIRDSVRDLSRSRTRGN